MKKVTIYSDGGCHGNPGPGAWAAVLQYGKHVREITGGTAATSVTGASLGTGAQLDVLARQFLWQDGVDYDHGTGHGVGAFLCVHEGPQRISKRGGDVALQAGMILSNEPGYYKDGEYGIRIENLVAVKEAQIKGADRRYIEFETLTLAPIDRNCIDVGLLTEAEKAAMPPVMPSTR